jgi:hypothetical protein
MDATRRDLIMQRWNVIEQDLLPELYDQVGALTPKLEKLIYILAPSGSGLTFIHCINLCVSAAVFS